VRKSSCEQQKRRGSMSTPLTSVAIYGQGK
jgi:hypothetical protein